MKIRTYILQMSGNGDSEVRFYHFYFKDYENFCYQMQDENMNYFNSQMIPTQKANN